MSSLQDQLLKAGLASKKQAKSAKQQQRKASKARKGQGQVEEDTIKAAVQAKQADQARKSRQLNAERESHKKATELKAQAQQLIEQHALNLSDEAELAYRFAHGKQIKVMYIEPMQQSALAKGHLAITELAGEYKLIPAQVARRIEARLPDYFILCHETQEADPDDPYADYQIPDDLIW